MKPLSLGDIALQGITLIEASAGTGKTWTIASLYIRLVLEQGLKPDQILVVTYTKAATAELRDRIRQRLVATLELFNGGRAPGDELEQLLAKRCRDRVRAVRLLNRAVQGFDDASIFTIHGFCQRALTEHAFESGSLFDTELSADQSEVVRETADDFWRSRLFGRTDAFLKRLLSERLTPDALLEPFAGHLHTPGLQLVLPEAAAEYGDCAAGVERLFHQCAALWRGERDSIVTLLTCPGLHQGSYKPIQVEAAAQQLDDWFDSGAWLPFCPKLSLFNQDTLEKRTARGAETPRHAFFGLCRELAAAAAVADEAYAAARSRTMAELAHWMRTELPRRKRSKNLRSYDDLLLDLLAALEGDGGNLLAERIRQRYPAALIDEFQDTDPLQWGIFARIAAQLPDAAPYPLYLIGDPKQAIYSFRGADVFAYLAAARAVGADRRWTLDTNRRSTPLLVDAVNGLFTGEDPFLCPEIRFDRVRAGRPADDRLLFDGEADPSPLQFWVYPRGAAKPPAKGEVRAPIAAAVAAEIARLLSGAWRFATTDGERTPHPGDMAVLVRTHAQAELIQQALTAIGIPSVQHGNATIFETPEARDLLRLLHALAAPHRESLVKEALLGGLSGLNVDDLAMALADEAAWETWLVRFRELRECWERGGAVAVTAHLLGTCGARERLLRLPDGERRLTNLHHCTELLHQAAEEGVVSLDAAIIWLERRVAGKREDDTALLRLETDDQAVQIVTIHASKGLQYRVVFLPYAWDVPSRESDYPLCHDDGGALTLDLGSGQWETHRRRAREERQAEAVRLLYVALTRAEFRCYVVWGAISHADDSPLFRLIHGADGQHLKDLDDAAIFRALAQLAERSPGIAATNMPPAADAPAYRPAAPAAEPYRCAELSAIIADDWRVASFTSLAAPAERHQQPRDYDLPDAAEAAPDAPRTTTGEASLLDFPRGAAAGTCLHEIFERIDFGHAPRETVSRIVASRLLANGFAPQWTAAVADMTEAVLTAPLTGEPGGFRLCDLESGKSRAELEFFLPVQALNGRLLATLAGSGEEGLAAALAGLNIREMRGMLHGFIDLVCEHRGRYYLIDWKSNYLGPRLADYSRERMAEAMHQHAYHLQYHLYTLALDRLLRVQLPGYDYERHFGGVVYVFLRGVSASSPETGLYRCRPPEAFIRQANTTLLAAAALNA